MNVPDALTGLPRPLLAAGAAVGLTAGVVLARRARRRPAATIPADRPAPADTTRPINPLGWTMAGTGNTATGDSASPSTPLAATIPALGSNNDWRTSATRFLIARGFAPYEVDTALAHYLQSETLTAQQVALVELALQAVGPLPEPIPAPPSTIAAPGTSTTPPGAWVPTPALSPKDQQMQTMLDIQARAIAANVAAGATVVPTCLGCR